MLCSETDSLTSKIKEIPETKSPLEQQRLYDDLIRDWKGGTSGYMVELSHVVDLMYHAVKCHLQLDVRFTTSEIRRSRATISVGDLGKSVYALKVVDKSLDWSSESPQMQEALQLVSALVPKVQACDDEPLAKNLSMALYGLQNLSAHRAEVRQLVAALVPKVQNIYYLFF